MQIVTGAFGFSGKYIARQLLSDGADVLTLTNSTNRENEFGDKIKISPFHFDDIEKLTEVLRDAEVLYNTYWVRFNHTSFQHKTAVENTLKLFEAAKKAGVKRIVHTSITNPGEHSRLEYFRGKAVLERELMDSGMSFAIFRPAVLFGDEDILINNMAWMIRKFPFFGVFGDGKYRLQPIYVEDFAKLMILAGKIRENILMDTVGPETFTYKELIQNISKIILGKERFIFSVSDDLGYMISKIIGWFTGDKMVTREEIKGLKADLLYTDSEPVGTTKLTDWLRAHKDSIGKKYANEMKRRTNREISYLK
ncbi:MAG: NAD-dependent epimerase/dehydratase family protein [Flavobacteriaceae bacterium]|jgi:NADH dehydrogenase|nr:NAD-dependent epimerase/dehydratase family protein [Flavobacteriaceae bacterium]